MCIPQFIVLAKGKFAMAAFLELLPPGQVKVFFPPSLLRYGGSGLPNIRVDSRRTMSPSPTLLAQQFLPSSTFSLFLLTSETAFIVGSSGSGKSTVAHRPPPSEDVRTSEMKHPFRQMRHANVGRELVAVSRCLRW